MRISRKFSKFLLFYFLGKIITRQIRTLFGKTCRYYDHSYPGFNRWHSVSIWWTFVVGIWSILCHDSYWGSYDTQLELQQQTQQEAQNVVELRSLIQLLGSISIALGAIVLAIGIGYLVVSYGLLKGRISRRTFMLEVIITIHNIV
jgi:hypothetical protein